MHGVKLIVEICPWEDFICVCVLKDWDTRKLIIVLSVVEFRKKDRQENGREWGVRLCFSSLKNVPLFSLNPYTA